LKQRNAPGGGHDGLLPHHQENHPDGPGTGEGEGGGTDAEQHVAQQHLVALSRPVGPIRKEVTGMRNNTWS
jgi:hypothetical protein